MKPLCGLICMLALISGCGIPPEPSIAGPWMGPRGTLRVTVVDGAGRPIEADCVPVPMDKRVRDSFLPRTVRNGICEERGIAAIDWDVQISYIDRSDEVVKVSEQVRVPADGVGTATIVVDP